MKTKPFLSYPALYRNLKYGFAIWFPRSWMPYLAADRKASTISPQETLLSFRFRYRGVVYTPVITIDISPLTGKAWRRYFEDSPVQFLGEHNGLTYGYFLAEELPDPFIEDEAKFRRAIRIMTKCVQEAPRVMKSFHYIRSVGYPFSRRCRPSP